MDFIKIGNATIDRSSYVQNGNFEINGEGQSLQSEKYSENEKNRTYKLTNQDGGIYLATFGGQNPKTQQMVSEFYARVFDNQELIVKPIVYKDMDNLEGIINPDIDPKTLDKNKKIGLGVFFSNDEQFDYISFAGTLDETSRSHNTVFSIIPTEFNTLLDNENYTREDIVQALETVANISDEEIKETLAKYDSNERFEDILLKRRDFMAKMLEQIKFTEQNENESIKTYIQRIPGLTANSTIDSINKIADLNSYMKGIHFIQDEKLRSLLMEKINSKKAELTNQAASLPLEPFTMEQLNATIEKFGGIKNIENNMAKAWHIEDIELNGVIFENGDEYIECTLKRFNELRNLGIDPSKDMESFTKLAMYAALTRRSYTYQTNAVSYKMMTDAIFNAFPNEAELKAIKKYKGDGYMYLHNGTDVLLKDDVEPYENNLKEHIENLNNYLHKHKTVEDINVFRGENASLFSNVQMPNGKNLGEEINNINRQLIALEKKRIAEIPNELLNQIHKLIDLVNSQPIDVINTRFCSTSVDRKVADAYHSVTLEINLPAGSSAACIDGFNPNGAYIGETEILTSYGAVEHITGAYFDAETKRIVFKTTLITDVDN